MSYLSDSEYAPENSPAPLRSTAIQALHRYNIVGTPTEEAFDAIARLAASFCRTPIALITFVGSGCQWFKSHIGLERQEAPLTWGFCPITIAKREPLVIPNTLATSVYAANPAVVGDPSVRFYAGVPLRTSDGEAIGSLCVMDRVPHRLTEDQLYALRTLSGQIMTLLDFRVAQRALQQREADSSHRIVRRFTSTEASRLQELLSVLAGARCLLWYADIREGGHPTLLHWEANFINEEAAQKFLPLEIRPGETYKDARYHARLPEDREICDYITLISIRAGKSYEQEFRCRAADGSIHWLHEDIRVETVIEGRQWRAVGVCTDITDRKRVEQEIETLNARLRRSVQETHHRVKNNLQIISALVELETEENAPTVSATSLKRIGHHTRSLAAIHELLTHQTRINPQADTLATQETLESLLPLLQATVDGREIRYHVENVSLPVQQISGLSLLINELIANAARHGKGTIDLSLTVQDGKARLEVSDDGPGFPPDFDWRSAAHTGMHLIDSAGCHELRGEIAFENRPEGGARVVVTFPVLPPS